MNSCAAHPSGNPADRPPFTQAAIELAALESVAYDEHPKSARYDRDDDSVYLTFYVRDTPMTDEELENAESAADDALSTYGVDVVVDTTESPVPTEH